MGVWRRLWSLLQNQNSPRLGPSDKPQLPKPPEDDPLAIVHRASQNLGYLSERPQRLEPSVLAALAALAESGREESAIRLGLGLARAVPTDSALLQLVVELLCRAHRYAEALGPLRQALSVAKIEEQARLMSLLATAHEGLGEHDAVRQWLAELVALDVSYPDARRRLSQKRPRQALTTASTQAGMEALAKRAVFPTVALLTKSRYELVDELGVGRTGTVYKARDRELGLDIALKVFHPHLRQQHVDDALLRALHEARLLATARHPGIVALYAIEGDELGTDGTPPMLAMELCRGGSLRRRLQPCTMSVDVALCRAVELLETLADLHQGGVAHGDLKPENLLFRGDGRSRYALPEAEQGLGDLVVADFGLSRLGAQQGGVGVGTLGYLAYERYLGAPPSASADVFAAAVIVIEMLGGGALPVANPPRALADAGHRLLESASLSALGRREAAFRAWAAYALSATAKNRPLAAESAESLRALLD